MMSMGIWELMLIAVIVLILFGGSRLRNLGSDVGTAIRGFRDAMKDGEKGDKQEAKDDTLPEKLEHTAPNQAGATTVDATFKERDKV